MSADKLKKLPLSIRLNIEALSDVIKEFELAASANQTTKEEWYHKTLTRGNAEHILRKAGSLQGLFLVRESITVPNGFVLSLIHNGKAQHFQINTSPNSGCFSIDNGPPFVGLDQLINFYCNGCHGLPTKLAVPCKGYKLNPFLRQFGGETIIHRAIEEGLEVSIFKQILQHEHCPNLNIRNMKGRTALQEATMRGLNDIVLLLNKFKADVRTRDSEGNSALHLACRTNKSHTLQLLLTHCGAKPQDRCCGSGWVPLHEACFYGHVKCAETLLKHGAACHPRCVKGETPLMVAKRMNHTTCWAMLERHLPHVPPRFAQHQWLHQAVDRHKAVELLEREGLEDGCFLVRISKRNRGQHVLTMSFDKAVFNYEIKNKLNDKNINESWFYIDDGPLFASLAHLVDYYCRYSDGLPAELTKPVSPFSTRKIRPSLPAPASTAAKFQQQQQHSQMTSLASAGGLNFAKPSNKNKKPPVINSSSIILGRELGQGEFGSVLMGVWRNENDKSVAVALKTLRNEHICAGEAEFQKEADLMMQLDHPCIVRLYGICRGESLMMVQELVVMGSALDYILDYPKAVGLNDFKLWAAQIASGMTYLEESGFVHRDLALRNILLSSRQLVKISDFGLSRAVGTTNYYKASSGGRWPVKWYAPESINYGQFLSSSDVWSYGVTLWEIFTKGEQPYNDMGGTDVVKFIEDGHRLEHPKDCPMKIYNIMLQCWSKLPTDRPTFSQLHRKFRSDPDYFNVEVPGHQPHLPNTVTNNNNNQQQQQQVIQLQQRPK